jgi:hypothetical protein
MGPRPISKDSRRWRDAASKGQLETNDDAGQALDLGLCRMRATTKDADW